jgi:hypothetical protein
MRNEPEDLDPFGEVEIRGREAKLVAWTIVGDAKLPRDL